MDIAKATSVRQRLLNLAHSTDEDYNQLLLRYVGLRFLARLANSDYVNRFLLKGATMFLVWSGSTHRPTRDIDLLGYVEADAASLAETMRSICGLEVEPDGVWFDPASVTVEQIREDTAYGGLRCSIEASMGSARLRVQIDVGFGDDVTPEPTLVELPRLLPDEVLRHLRAYTPETVIAEKFEAIVKLGLANSRMKDYYDLDILLARSTCDRGILREALRRTFSRRETKLPQNVPAGLTAAYWGDALCQRRWGAFLRKNGLASDSLEEVCQRINASIGPLLADE